MSVFGYQSDQILTTVNNTTVNNASPLGDHTFFRIRPEDTESNITFNPNRDNYLVTSTNILIGGDIIFRRVAGLGSFNGERIFRLPRKAFFSGFSRSSSGITFSNTRNPFFYRIDANGHVFLTGAITSLNEEVIFNFTPYAVATPLSFVNF